MHRKSNICSKCKVSKPTSEFSKHSRSKDGLRYRCKSCERDYQRKWREANREYNNANPECQPEIKVCSRCNVFKPCSEFPKDMKRKGGRRGVCNSCVREYQQKYKEANKEIIAEKEKKYRETNRDKIAESNKKYYQENKESVRGYCLPLGNSGVDS